MHHKDIATALSSLVQFLLSLASWGDKMQARFSQEGAKGIVAFKGPGREGALDKGPPQVRLAGRGGREASAEVLLEVGRRRSEMKGVDVLSNFLCLSEILDRFL